jgi:tripartite-type tricarboxylate transporter receptor subunit TctC
MPFKSLIRSAMLALTVASTVAGAQTFPAKPIRIVVGFGAGGGSDVVARVYANKLQEILKSPVIVENKPGAFELIAAQSLVTSPPDGYTLWMATSGSLLMIPAMRSDLPYDPLKSLTLLAGAADVDAVYAVKKSLPVRDLGEFVAYAKQNPGKLNFGSAGMGSLSHMLPEYLKVITGVQMTHVPFKSGNEVMTALTAETIDFSIMALTGTAPLIHQGNFKGIGVTSQQRVKEMPGVQSVGENASPELKGLVGPYSIYALVAPAGVPPAVAKVLEGAIAQAAKSPDVQQRLAGLQMRATYVPSAQLRDSIERELPKWRLVAAKVNAKP